MTACGASRAAFRDNLASWTGQRETALVAAWGAPDRLYEVEGIRFLTYTSSRTTVDHGTKPATKTEQRNKTLLSALADVLLNAEPRPTVTVRTCSVTFSIAGGTVQSSRYDGNDCTSNF